MFRNSSEYVGLVQYPQNTVALLSAAKDRTAKLIILGLFKKIAVSEAKSHDGIVGRMMGLGKNDPWTLSLIIETEIIAMNDKGEVIYKNSYSNEETTTWTQWRAFGTADINEMHKAVHALYDNIFEKQVSKFLFALSEDSDFKQILPPTS